MSEIRKHEVRQHCLQNLILKTNMIGYVFSHLADLSLPPPWLIVPSLELSVWAVLSLDFRRNVAPVARASYQPFHFTFIHLSIFWHFKYFSKTFFKLSRPFTEVVYVLFFESNTKTKARFAFQKIKRRNYMRLFVLFASRRKRALLYTVRDCVACGDWPIGRLPIDLCLRNTY